MTGTGLVRRLARAGGAVVTVLAAVALPLAAPASAQPNYPPAFNQITASSFVVVARSSITFTAQTYQPGASVRWAAVVDGRTVASGTAVASAKGVVEQAVTFDVVGRNVVTFRGTGADGAPLALTARVTVIAAPGSGPGTEEPASNGGNVPAVGGLPRTGAQILGSLLAAAVLVGAGTLLVTAARRRRRTAP